jgi:5-formyltetrahydrofolate cyclo-ligase
LAATRPRLSRRPVSRSPCFALGCAFAVQQVDAVPAGPNDVALGAIATERGIIRQGENCQEKNCRGKN